MEDKTPIDAIHRLMPEIEESREKIRKIREQLKDVMEQNDEYRKLEEEIKELSGKRAEAKKLLMADPLSYSSLCLTQTRTSRLSTPT